MCRRAVRVGGHDIHVDKFGAGIQRFTNHHAGLGPLIGAFNTFDSRDDRAGAGERLVGVVELIGRAPDIRAGGGHRIRAGRPFDKAADRGGKAMEP